METPLYNRTTQGWQALARPDALDRRAHTLLLLANGRRTIRELSRLLDEDVSDVAKRMSAQGYLQDMRALAAIEAEDEAA